MRTVAQEAVPPLTQNDPPRLSLITVSPYDDPLTVLITGDSGAVFPSAQVAIRNLYTGTTVYTQARYDGAFTATIAGTHFMPYQINSAPSFDPLQNPSILAGMGRVWHPNYAPLLGQTVFGVGGELAYGAGHWLANGFINQVNFAPNDPFSLRLDVAFTDIVRDPQATPIISAHLALRPLWSDTPMDESPLATSATDGLHTDDASESITFTLNFGGQIPSLADGAYLIVLRGDYQLTAASHPSDWYANRLLDTRGEQTSGTSETILPLIIHIGAGQSTLPSQIIAFDPPQPPIVPQGDFQQFPILPDLPLTLPLVEAQWQADRLPLIVRAGYLSLPIDPYRFGTEYGESSWQLNATLHDAFGRDYSLNKQHQITVSESLTLHPSLLTGIPLQIGQVSALAGTVSPPLSAQLTLNQTTIQTSRFGYFFAGDVQAEQVGDYHFVWNGNAQLGTIPYTFARTDQGVIAADTPPAHGDYGLVGYAGQPQAWFNTLTYPDDAPDVPPIIPFPYYSGDVAYLPDGDVAGIQATLTGAEGTQYLSITRADQTLLQLETVQPPYNPTHRIHNDTVLPHAVGIGVAGNRPQDLLWLFGGIVSQAGNSASGYSALAVVTDDDPVRVVPPFSEPLFYDDGAALMMAVLPTAVKAGQVLEVGETFALSAIVAPPVPADLDTLIITPSGERLTHHMTASRFGYAYQAQHNFTVQETGVYRVFMDASYAGDTSAGLLSQPVRGSVLGSAGGAFLVFAVDPAAPMLTTAREALTTVANGQPFSINLRAPDDWQDVQAYYVVRTAQWILEQGELDTFANQTNYNFNWGQLAARYPNLESSATAATDRDEIILSFAFTGRDAAGNTQTRARMFVLRGNALITATQP